MPACPLCGAAAAECFRTPIDAKTFAPTRFGTVQRCGACDFLFIAPRPGVDETRAFYALDAYYTHGGRPVAAVARSVPSRVRVGLGWRVDHGESPVAMLAARLGGAGAAVCDVGCGDGHYARELVARGFVVTGVERDRRAAAFDDPNFRFVEAEVESLGAVLPAGRFDAVLMTHVLEHLVDPVRALQALRRLLRPGGWAVVEVPNNACVAARRSGLAWEHLDIPRHLSFFTPATLRRAAEVAGLRVERFYFEGYVRQFFDSLIETEQRLHDALTRELGAPPSFGVRNSQRRAWGLLARTAFAAPARKYDSVGIVARAGRV